MPASECTFKTVIPGGVLIRMVLKKKKGKKNI